ncbi:MULTISPECIES: LysR family transcriptional regulator [Pandoraea]|uniref:LysR family transcriptional regulator n=1 Tax=Pandoraea communis TaxID=2508297 RepID=A0A5E4Z437_9BURK|nr:MULTISPECIES: LysR family transcriptional regulator [Pandoraea]EON14214.1 LysR family transcriptional regulator [Pandoraea sp. SD6-2]VVE55934.1 LysR family transcriptional regulator [Pandoraea communis]
MDRLKCMEVFVQVVRAGSLSAGAAACGMSAVTAARHVQVLEARLGQPLLRRNGRRQVPTALGQRYFAECAEVLARVENADALGDAGPAGASMPGAISRPVGQLRVSAPTTVGSHLLMPIFAEYLQSHPDVALDLALKDRVVDLEEEGIHAAFQAGGNPVPGLVAHTLRGVTRVACASPAYLARRGVPRQPVDLAGHDCLGFRYDDVLGRWVFTQAGASGGTVRDARLIAHNPLAQLQAAVHGMGIALLPEYLLAPEVQAGRLVRVLEADVQLSEPMHLVHLAGRFVSSKLDDFVRYMVAKLGPEACPAATSA